MKIFGSQSSYELFVVLTDIEALLYGEVFPRSKAHLHP